VFDLCDGQLAVQAIVERIVHEFEVEPSVALSDVQRFVRELSLAGALELGDPLQPADLKAADAKAAP
jgi:hypothetical protein